MLLGIALTFQYVFLVTLIAHFIYPDKVLSNNTAFLALHIQNCTVKFHITGSSVLSLCIFITQSGTVPSKKYTLSGP